HLRVTVSPARERQDHVVVSLGQSIAVTRAALAALAIGIQDLLVNAGSVVFQPGKKCGTEVEADALVIVGDANDPTITRQDARRAVRSVALCGDALIPVVERIRGILQLDGFQPGVLPRGLVKMTMNAKKALHDG